MTNRIPELTQSPEAVCTQFKFVTPALYDIHSLEQAVAAHPEEAVTGEVYHGTSCKSTKIASYHVSCFTIQIYSVIMIIIKKNGIFDYSK